MAATSAQDTRRFWPWHSSTPVYRVDFKGANGMTVRVTPLDKSFTIDQFHRTLADPKTTAAQRNKLMERIGQIQQKMAEDIVKALKTDPAGANKQQDDFGCGSLQLYPGKVGAVTGAFSCGKNFNGGTVKVTGRMTQVK